MSRVLVPPFGSRRMVLLLIVIAGALLVAAGLLIDPATDRRGSDTAGTVESPELVDPAVPDGGEQIAEAPVETGMAREAAADAADGAGISAEADVQSITPPHSSLDAPSLDARIIRTATIQLRLRRGGFEEGWSDAQSVAGAFGGYVASASRSGTGDGPRVGTITMRVPSAKFDAAVDRLRDLDRARVERLDVASQDVTQEYVDVRSRLRHDRAVEARLLALLAQTRGVSEVLAVQARLDQVQEQIEISRGRLQYLEKLTEMSTIELSLRDPGTRGAKPDEDETSALGEAWDDALERFTGNIARAIVWLGGALPTVILVVLLAIVGRVAWRRHTRDRHPVDGANPTP